jgi:hypothetical protein
VDGPKNVERYGEFICLPLQSVDISTFDCVCSSSSAPEAIEIGTPGTFLKEIGDLWPSKETLVLSLQFR